MQVGRWARAHGRRMAVEAANVVLNHDVVFRAIGVVNRRVGLVESVFLAYPGSEKYALAYGYRRRIERQRWSPWPTGVLVQNGRVTLMFAVSSHDEHYQVWGNGDDLKSLACRLEQIRSMVGARQKTFAGVLPGVLATHGILTDPPEGDITANVVAEAVRNVRDGDWAGAPVIVLGGRGFVGRRLVATLLSEGIQVHSVDVCDDRDCWPEHLVGTRVVLVNVANRHASRAIWTGCGRG